MRHNEYGGYTTGTLCGRQAMGEDINGTEEETEVTCKICLNAIDNPANWRWRKYLETAIN